MSEGVERLASRVRVTAWGPRTILCLVGPADSAWRALAWSSGAALDHSATLVVAYKKRRPLPIYADGVIYGPTCLVADSGADASLEQRIADECREVAVSAHCHILAVDDFASVKSAVHRRRPDLIVTGSAAWWRSAPFGPARLRRSIDVPLLVIP